jgi:protein SCO1/2
MKTFSIGINISVYLLLIAWGGCMHPKDEHVRDGKLPFYNEATFTPIWSDPDGHELRDFHQIGAFELINQDSQLISNESLDGKIYIADFFFTTCPGICSKMTSNMSIVQEAFMDDDDVLLISHSVTPQKDSVSVLKAYAEARGVKSGKWHLLTGDRSVIYNLGRKNYFVEEDLGLTKNDDEFLHTENFVLIDRAGRIRGIYNGLNKGSVQQLIEDIKVLKKEA